MPNLVCKKVQFYSEGDEIAFFKWIKNIECVSDVTGINDEIHIVVEEENVPDEVLREFIAVFTRYQIDLSQLAQFKTESNKDWFFNNKAAFWHEPVFGMD